MPYAAQVFSRNSWISSHKLQDNKLNGFRFLHISVLTQKSLKQ